MRTIATRSIIAAYHHSWRIDNGQHQPLTLILFRVLLTIRISITPSPAIYEGCWCTTHAAFELGSKVASKQPYRIFRIHRSLSLRNNPQVQFSGGTEVIRVGELLPNTQHFPQFRIQAVIKCFFSDKSLVAEVAWLTCCLLWPNRRVARSSIVVGARSASPK
jgi:hypothetical protein